MFLLLKFYPQRVTPQVHLPPTWGSGSVHPTWSAAFSELASVVIAARQQSIRCGNFIDKVLHGKPLPESTAGDFTISWAARGQCRPKDCDRLHLRPIRIPPMNRLRPYTEWDHGNCDHMLPWHASVTYHPELCYGAGELALNSEGSEGHDDDEESDDGSDDRSEETDASKSELRLGVKCTYTQGLCPQWASSKMFGFSWWKIRALDIGVGGESLIFWKRMIYYLHFYFEVYYSSTEHRAVWSCNSKNAMV